jgi:hypothetical protein
MIILAGNPERSFQRNVMVLYCVFGLFGLFAFYFYMVSIFFHPRMSLFIFGSLFFHGMVVMAIIRLYKIFKYSNILKNRRYTFLYLIIFILILLLFGLSYAYSPTIFYGCFALEVRALKWFHIGLAILQVGQVNSFLKS